ncbi:MAG: copper resistance CopC/CopD family protein [Methanobacteriota archaeon]
MRFVGLAHGLALGLALALALFPSAAAHAYIVQSHPGNGDRWDELPPSVHLLFTEGLQRGEAVVLDDRGGRVDTGAFDLDPQDARSAYVPLMQGGPGVYVLQWRVLSVDTHVTSGSLYFVVGNASPTRETILAAHGSQTHGASDYLPASLAKGVLLAGLAVLLGVPAVVWLVARPRLYGGDIPPDALARGRRVILAAAVSAVGASLALAVPRLVEFSGSGGELFEAVRTTATGRLLILQQGALVLTVLVATFRAETKRLLAFAPCAAIVSQAGMSVLSHSGSFVGRTVGAGADFLHLLGAAFWFGGLVAVLFVVLPSRGADGLDLGRFVRWFSPWAWSGLALSAAAGLLIASWFVPSPGSVATTLYGRAVAGKTVLLAGSVCLAGVNRLVLAPRLGGHPRAKSALRNALRAEVALLAVVFLLSGVLTTVPTAVVGEHTAAVRTFEERSAFGLAHARFLVVPATVGFNVFDVTLVRGGSPWDGAGEITLLLRESGTGIELPAAVLSPSGDGRYSAVAVIPFPGNWSARYSYFHEGFHASTFGLEVAPSSAAHEAHAAQGATVSEGPLRAPLAIASGVAAAVGAAVLVVELALLSREARREARP